LISPTTVSNGGRASVGFTDRGQLMNQGGAALQSTESDGTYEHLATGAPEEGYALFYADNAGDHAAWDVYDADSNMGMGNAQIVRNDGSQLVKQSDVGTADGRLRIRQTFTWSTLTTRVDIRMYITNVTNEDLSNVLVKRYADLDVDTGGTRGWALFENHWLVNNDSVMAFNYPSEAPTGRRAHIVNAVAMPGDFPYLGSFAGFMGAQQYDQRPNSSPVSSPYIRVDGVAVLQWHSDWLRSGETARLHCYYDTYCLCSNPFGGPPAGEPTNAEEIVLPDGKKYRLTQTLNQPVRAPDAK
jgi:hypothetical protein